jgi:hypothetical protein
MDEEITNEWVNEIELPEQDTQPELPPADLTVQADLKSQTAQEVLNIRKLIHAGVVAPWQGQNLIQQIIQRAYSVITNQKDTPPAVINDEFFSREGRSEVLDYLKNSNISKEEVSRVTALVEKVEKAAIADYLKQQEREKTLNDVNEATKRKLKVNAQKPCGSVKMVFTREQIGKMSGAEFAQHERSIMEQLRKGLIK